MSDFFYSIMEDLYTLFHREPPKEFGLASTFTLRSKLKVSFQMEDNPHGIYMSSLIGRVPSGPSRVLWLQEALRWNSEIDEIGMLAFNKEQEVLVIGHLFSIHHVQAQMIYEALDRFEARALPWIEGCELGRPPILPGASALNVSNAPGPMSVASNLASSRYRTLRP